MDHLNKFICLLSSSMVQAIADNPFTSYRQLLQQYTKDSNANYINPRLTNQKVRKIFLKNPINVAFSGLKVRLNTPLATMEALYGSFEDVNYHSENKHLRAAIDAIAEQEAKKDQNDFLIVLLVNANLKSQLQNHVHLMPSLRRKK